ncbi:MAG: response regulator transcription factor [Pseudonocardiales bacterium]|nr:response regulator transcription factor [Pseudonocardiales bacterium]MBV9029876.1 response regulator transcription factor [Pseudonocardiales bacterium]
MTFVRVLLIDPHLMLTDALTVRLSTAADLWVVGSAAPEDPRLLDMVRTARPDVITSEIGPATVATAVLLRRLRAAYPPAHLVVLTGSHDCAQAVAAARAGASAWVSKESSLEHLLEVLRGVPLGHAFYPPRQLGVVLRALREDVWRARDCSARLDVLSHREREVLLRMVDGEPVSRIAAESVVSTSTVRTHVRSILIKLGVRSRLEAVSVARAAGLRPVAD